MFRNTNNCLSLFVAEYKNVFFSNFRSNTIQVMRIIFECIDSNHITKHKSYILETNIVRMHVRITINKKTTLTSYTHFCYVFNALVTQ